MAQDGGVCGPRKSNYDCDWNYVGAIIDDTYNKSKNNNNDNKNKNKNNV